MEAFRSNTQMMEMKGKGAEASWLPDFEVDGSGALLSRTQYDDAGLITNTAVDRRVLVTRLLEALEDQPLQNEEPDYGWMEAPMDLEIFEQSLRCLADESLALTHDSSWVSSPATPIFPSSPQTSFDHQVDVWAIKPEQADAADNSEHLLETLELMMKEIQDDEASPSTAKIAELDLLEDDGAEDVTSAILDSLIQGNTEEDVVLAEISDMALEWMGNPAPESPVFIGSPPAPESPIPSVASSSDIEFVPSPSSESEKAFEPVTSRPCVTKSKARGRKARIQPEERKSRKKEQNKTAATRYREKKKLELGLAHVEESILAEKNRKLRKQLDALTQELRFMKRLVRDVFNSPAKTR